MAAEEENRKRETASRAGAVSFVASLIESVVTFLYLLFLTVVDKLPHITAPNQEFNTFDDIEFLLWIFLPLPLLLLFIIGLVLGIVGFRSRRGKIGLSLAIISPFWGGLWLFCFAFTH